MDSVMFSMIILFNITAILLLRKVYRAYAKLLKKSDVDDKTLEESVRGAGQYGNAYLIDEEWEMIRLAFYNLVARGYLKKIEPTHDFPRHKHGIPPREYTLNKQADLNALNHLEKKAALLYEKDSFIFLPEIYDESNEIVKKIDPAFLINPNLPCFDYLCVMLVTLVFGFDLIFLAVELSMLSQKMHRIDPGNFSYYAASLPLLGILIIGIMRTQKISKALNKKNESNIKRYREFCDKSYPVYPDLKAGPLTKYVDQIIFED